jgi:hypothetical protein
MTARIHEAHLGIFLRHERQEHFETGIDMFIV